MDDLNDYYYFAEVVERGGFSAASRALGIPKSRLSRRIAGLEQRLGLRLLQRSTRKLVLTPVGEHVYQRARAMVVEAQGVQAVAAQALAEPCGSLRVTCAVTLAQISLAPILPKFLARYPRLRLLLDVSNRRIDVLEERVDVALRVREEPPEDSSLVVRHFRPSPRLLVCTPALRAEHGTPAQPADLARWPVLAFTSREAQLRWSFVSASGESREVTLEARFGAGDLAVLHAATLAGLGATILPVNLCATDIADGRLVELLPDWRAPPGRVQAVYASARGLLPAVRAFVEFLAQEWGDELSVDQTPPAA